MNIEIDIDNKRLKQAFDRAPRVVTTKLRGWVAESAALSERSAKQHITQDVSRGSSGITRSSIHQITGLNRLSTTVKPTVKYAYWVHEGRKPGKMPPFGEGSSLNRWAKRMGMNPFLVARKIAKSGTKGHPFMEEAYREVKPVSERKAGEVINDIIRSI